MMKHLVLDYKSKIETLKKETIGSLRHEQNQSVKDLFFILTGKLLAYEECIKEIDRLLKYDDEFIKH